MKMKYGSGMNNMIFQLGEITVRAEYRRIRHMNLYVRPAQGEVLLTVPAGTPWSEAECFLQSKEGWIRRHLQSASQDPGISGQLKAGREQIRQMRERTAAYAAEWEPVMGVHAASWTLRDMKTRWGSCTVNTGRIRLNTRLVFYPPECLEYVIVHELCHLIEPSHNQRFHMLMTRFLPDWKERKRKLNGTHMDCGCGGAGR